MTGSRSNVLVFVWMLAAALPAVGHTQTARDRGSRPFDSRDGFEPPRFIGSPGNKPGGDPFPGGPRAPLQGKVDVVPLTNVVAMVQERFNATAVKTDTVLEEDQLVYRIRLLSADKSRVWTVRVDARTGQVK